MVQGILAGSHLHQMQVKLRGRRVLKTWYRFKRKTVTRQKMTLPALEELSPGVHRLRLAATEPNANMLQLVLPAAADEAFVGFGERFNGVNQRGQRLEVWTEEGAIGLGERWSPLLTRLGVKFNPLPKGPTTAYKPMPWFISSRGYGLYIATSAPVFFDVAASDPSVVTCEIAAPVVDVVVFTGETPAAILQAFVKHLGLPRQLPDWAIGPWHDAVGGTAAVETMATLLRREEIPSSAIWTEDWGGAQWSFAGNTRWSWYDINPVRRRVDRKLYPDLEGLANQLHSSGFKFLGYYYPFLSTDDPDFKMAAEAGYLLRDADGKPLVFPFFTGQCGQIDLTNPAAKAWHGQELQRGIELGFDGWMADFGEYTPPESHTFDGHVGMEHHNVYPLLWARHNREVWDAARPDGDYVFFSRSASPGQQAETPVFWGGDSNTDFERWDGLPSNLPALLSAGLSGLSVWTTDIGGYMSLVTAARDEETLARWTEFGALLPVMRTHHGTHPRRSVQFHESPAALAHFRTYARLHVALFPLFRQLLDETTGAGNAAEAGLPVCRSLLLRFPHDPQCWRVEDAFIVGPDLLVAPILARGATHRSVYLPAGERWIDLWTGAVHEGGQLVTALAPIGRIPLFLRDGGHLVLLGGYADTLVPRRQVADPAVRTLEDGAAQMLMVVTPAFAGETTWYDKTVTQLGSEPVGTVLPEAAAPTCALLPPDLWSSWLLLGSGQGQSGSVRLRMPLRAGAYLQVAGVRERSLTVFGVGFVS